MGRGGGRVLLVYLSCSPHETLWFHGTGFFWSPLGTVLVHTGIHLGSFSNTEPDEGGKVTSPAQLPNLILPISSSPLFPNLLQTVFREWSSIYNRQFLLFIYFLQSKFGLEKPKLWRFCSFPVSVHTPSHLYNLRLWLVGVSDWRTCNLQLPPVCTRKTGVFILI